MQLGKLNTGGRNYALIIMEPLPSLERYITIMIYFLSLLFKLPMIGFLKNDG